MSELGKKLIASIRQLAYDNPFYVYEKVGNGDGACLYVLPDGSPSCGVGHSLVEHGLLDHEPDECGDTGIRNVAAHFDWALDDVEVDWLEAFQDHQDNRNTWPRSVLGADIHVGAL